MAARHRPLSRLACRTATLEREYAVAEGPGDHQGFKVMPTWSQAHFERRRPSLVVILPGLLLFGLMLFGAVLLFGQNFEQATSAGRWIGSTAFVLFSAVIVWALLRASILGSRTVPQREYSGSPVAMGGSQLNRGDAIVSWRFTPRWKEQLACASAQGEVVLEMMMIEPHVFFPTDDTWARQAPSWAKNRRAELLAELAQWCTAQGIPLTVDEEAWVAPP